MTRCDVASMTALALYTGLTWTLAPAIRLYLKKRVTAGKEDPARLEERFGRPGRARPEAPLVWAHAASVGEAISMLPLVEGLLTARPGLQVLVTTGTVTSARLLESRLPPGAFHQYVPVDLPMAVERFLDHWRPDLVLWAESEFWPNLLTRIDGRRTPIVLVNGRVSARSFDKWRRAGLLRPLIRRMLASFTLCLAQGHQDGEYLKALGGDQVRCHGNLKFAVPALPADAIELQALRHEIGDRPVWLAASIHLGEDAAIIKADAALRVRFPDLLTLVVPRHPVRGPEIAALARAESGQAMTIGQRSAGDRPAPGVGLYVADTLGEMGLWYRLASIVLMGGSLVPHGGQNPIEPAKLGAAILHGPHMENFSEIIGGLTACGGARLVPDAPRLADIVAGLLDDPPASRAMADAAGRFAAGEEQVLKRVMAELDPLLDVVSPRVAAE